MSKPRTTGSFQRNHHRHLTRYTQHRAAPGRMPKVEGPPDNQFAYQHEYGNPSGAGLLMNLIYHEHKFVNASLQHSQMESPGFPELEELSVASLADESRLFNDEYLQRILKTSTQLKLLDVRGCSRLTHDSLIRLPTWDLKHLFLSGCSITRDLG